jgi:hypothetical protein
MKLSQEQLIQIIELSLTKSSREIAKSFDVNKSTINYFLSRKTHNKFWTKYDSGHFCEEGTTITPDTLGEDDLTSIIEKSEDVDIVKLAKQVRTAQRTITMLRRVSRNTFDGIDSSKSLIEGVKQATQGFKDSGGIRLDYRPHTTVKNATLEVLFSDLQIGKVSRHFNTEVAKKSVRTYGLSILKELVARENKYSVERIVFAMIGDIVEDHLKHGVGSATSTDTGLSEQMADAIECVWEGLLKPLAELKIPMDVICVTGNHGSSLHKGMDSFKAGRFSYDFVIHHTLRKYCELSGFDHIKFNIPDGTFGHTEIYGKYAIYEHGYHNPQTEKGMQDQLAKRGNQLQIWPSYWRQGDKHHTIQFQNSHLCCNGAFFGMEDEGIEYSGILGFNSDPTQTIMFHVDDKRKGRSNIKETINIQLSQCE